MSKKPFAIGVQFMGTWTRPKITKNSRLSRLVTTEWVRFPDGHETQSNVSLVLLIDRLEYFSVRIESLIGGGHISHMKFALRIERPTLETLLKSQHVALCDFLEIEPHSQEYKDWLSNVLKHL